MSNMFDRVTKRTTEHGIRVSPWIVVDDYCAMRVIEGTDGDQLRNRVAFIEKSPRVRIHQTAGEPNAQGDWLYGPKGSGGHDGHIPENGLYGFDQRSRDWCDSMLMLLGYQLINDWADFR